MFQLICKKIPHWRRPAAFSLPWKIQDLCSLQIYHFSTSSSKLIPKSNKSKDFIINYLSETCRMTKKSAESYSKHFTFKTRKNPDSVISFFKNQGFTSNQISLILRRHPKILASTNPEITILPKLNYFRSIGLSTDDIVVMITRASSVLGRSLENQIIPVFRYLTSLLQSQENALVCIKYFSLILVQDLENVLIPNVGYLNEVGVPPENVATLVKNFARAFAHLPDRFKKDVDVVKSMGFDPLSSYFTAALYVIGRNGECLWKKKVGIYKSYGFSDADVYEAFKRHPFCMVNSSDKIRKVMDCFVNRMGFEPSLIVKCPKSTSFSLEKRIKPRCNVYQALLAKGLGPKKFTLRLLLVSEEKKFLSNFVEPFEAQVPGLLMIYRNSGAVST